MDRRSFARLSLWGAAAAVFAPRAVIAALPESPLAGGVYYTKDKPGRWAGKAAGHVPAIELEKADGATKVRVTTPHEMRGHDHYIIKHILLDQQFAFLDEKLFDPLKDKAPISEFTLKTYSGPLYALSFCNLHDLWLNMVEA